MVLWLRRIASCFFFTLAVLFAGLWVRSYFYSDTFLGVSERRGHKLVYTATGVLAVQYYSATNFDWFWFRSLRPERLRRATYGFAWLINSPIVNRKPSTISIIAAPFWLLTVVAGILAIAIRPAPRFKFSLRDLLSLTTVAALTVGPLAFWLRSIS